jgi:hypothetical protein
MYLDVPRSACSSRTALQFQSRQILMLELYSGVLHILSSDVMPVQMFVLFLLFSLQLFIPTLSASVHV